MSEIEPHRLAGWREKLLARDRFLRAEIEATRLGRDEIGADQLVGDVRDSGEESVAIHEQDLNHADLARDAGELREIAAALGRIRDGAYGWCVSCGQEIAAARLEAQPTAVRCLRCQSVFEKTHAGHPAPTL